MTEETKQEQPQMVKGNFCPHCGYDIDTPSIEITEDDKKEYFRRMMSGQLFEKEFVYMRGDVVFRMSELNTHQTDRLVELLRGVVDEQMIMAYAFRSKFMACCHYMKIGTEELITEKLEEIGTMEQMSALYDKTIGSKATPIAHLADDCLRDFTKIVDGAVQAMVTSKSF